MKDPSLAQYSVPLVKIMCQAKVGRAQLELDINYNGQVVAPISVNTALNCPKNCCSHGDCSGIILTSWVQWVQWSQTDK